MDKVLGEEVTFQIEVEDYPPRLILVLDRKCDYAIVPWQDAFHLSQVMEQVYLANYKLFKGPIPRSFVTMEQGMIRLNHHKGLVALVFSHTDRLVFTSIDAWLLVIYAIRQCAQDSKLEGDGVHISYDRAGMISKIHNSRTGETQQVR